MPEERGLYPKQPVLQQLVYLARLRGMPTGEARKVAIEHLERFGLAERASDKLESLSLGNQQRVQIAAAVMTEPTALVLDEPFSGLDPDAVDAMTDRMHHHAARGVPVLFSSHQLDLAEAATAGRKDEKDVKLMPSRPTPTNSVIWARASVRAWSGRSGRTSPSCRPSPCRSGSWPVRPPGGSRSSRSS